MGHVSRRQLLRLFVLAAAGGAAAVLEPGALFSQRALASAPGMPDAWSSRMTWRTTDGWYSSAIHATLMPDGRILLIGLDWPSATPVNVYDQRRSAFTMLPAAPGTPLGAELVPASVGEPLDANSWISGAWEVDDNLFCSGHTLTADGKFFSAGGTRTFVSPPRDGSGAPPDRSIVTGLSYSTLFDGQLWTRLPGAMQAQGSGGGTERWYPTATRLSDGRILVTSGFEVVIPSAQVNLTSEAYTPAASSWSVLSSFGQVPFELFSSDYTHTLALPGPVGGNDLLMFGEPGVPVLSASSAGASWNLSAPPRPGSEAFQTARRANGGSWDSLLAPNNGAATALLPIRVNDGDLGYGNGSVIIVGGARQTPHERSMDVYDPGAHTWRTTVATQAPRHFSAIVVLPDSRVLILSGAEADPNARHAEYVDPLSGFASSLGTSDGGEVRGYHNVALLLPNGSVLVGGGRDVDRDTTLEKSNFRYYYPYYIFADRPRITSAPLGVSVAQQFAVDSSGLPPTDAVMIALGSMTHCFDANQRVVQLKLLQVSQLAAGQYRSTVLAPPNAQIAPPGYYMLFVLDGRRIPSAAAMVQLHAAAPAAGMPRVQSPAARASLATHNKAALDAAIASAVRRATQSSTITPGFNFTCPIVGPVRPN